MIMLMRNKAVGFTDDQLDRVKRAATSLGVSQNALIRMAVDAYFGSKTEATILTKIDRMFEERDGPGGHAHELAELRDWIKPWNK